jgi:hypothetical protein
MASNTKEDEALELLWSAHFKELKDMSDADILEGADIPKLHGQCEVRGGASSPGCSQEATRYPDD